MKQLLIGLTALFLLSGCVSINGNFVRGSGKVATEERQVSGFQGVDVSGSGEAVFIQGEQEGVTIEMEDNLLPYLKTEVINGVLHIGFKDDGVLHSFQPTRPIKYEVRVKDLSSIDTSGAVNVNMASLSTTDLSINISGAGSVMIDDLTADQLSGNLSGATKLVLAGKVVEQKFDLSGSSTFDARDLESNIAILNASGSSNMKVWVHEDLHLSLSGSSDVTYYGTPKLTQDVSGSADIKAMGEK